MVGSYFLMDIRHEMWHKEVIISQDYRKTTIKHYYKASDIYITFPFVLILLPSYRETDKQHICVNMQLKKWLTQGYSYADEKVCTQTIFRVPRFLGRAPHL